MTETRKPAGWIGTQVPDSALFDLSEWPLVLARFPELDEENRVTRVLEGLDAILDQQKPYAVVWQVASHDHDDEPHEGEVISNKWIKRRRNDLNTYCRGYTYIVPDPSFRDELEDHLAVVRERLFQFPMEIAEHKEEAIEITKRMLEQAKPTAP